MYAAAPPVKTFLCPSAPTPTEVGNMPIVRLFGVRGKHFPAAGSVWGLAVHPPPTQPNGLHYNADTYLFATGAGDGPIVQGTAKTNYLVNVGFVASDADGLDAYLGPFRYNNGSGRGLAFTGITDGTSNTVGFAESAGGLTAPGGSANQAWTLEAYGHAYTASNFWLCPNPGNPNCVYTPSNGRGLGAGVPGSLHNGRVNIAFMDGSVRAINGGLDFVTYAFICGAQDGQVVTFD